MFDSRDLELLKNIVEQDLLRFIGETLVMTFVPTIIAFLIGLPLGILLVVGEEDGILPIPKALMKILHILINLLRSLPFLILLLVVMPLSRAIVGTSVGTAAMIVPLSIAAFPFVARLVETSIREVDHGVVEAALSMGASPAQIIWKVLIPEARPALIANFMVSMITIFGYGAMSGAVGGGGLGNMAIQYGYNRHRPLVMYAAAVLLILLVQIFQSIGNTVAKKSDRRLRS